MDIDRFKRLEELFDAAVALAPEQRHAYLEQACGDDTDLLALVDRMLQRVGVDTAALRAEVVTESVTLDMPTPGEAVPTLNPGDRVGRYVIREAIGEGGFAIVYAADQTEPVKRRVALKIIKVGMDTRQVIARFEAERQALAMMDHAGVAKVFDAGATETGRPYFVMEFVAGTPITEYCDRHRLSIDQRLQLFMQVCEAVQHAHQKAIIHRDIKPSNVLVEVKDGAPLVKVIDFGVAKAISHRLTEKTIYTEQGQLIGTPEYMSPEQAEMTAENVDTRSDIYSLGVLLYEMLTGALPFDSSTLRRAAFGEIQRVIREEEPPKPSTRLSSLGDESATNAQRRRADPRSLLRELRGDLDWITMKALEKDRSRRYDTANGMALDIRRHLDHEPVLAGPPRAPYRVRKFVRRNRLAVTAGGAIGVALVTGLTLSLVGFTQAVRQQNVAEAERARALDARDESEAVTEFLAEMLSSASPWEQGKDVSMRQVLDAAAERLQDKFADQPSIRARLHQTIGDAYTDLAVRDRAESHLKAAMVEYQKLHGDDHPATGEVFGYLGKLYWMWGRPEEAERWLTKAHEILAHHLGPDDEKTVKALGSLGFTRADERLLREALALAKDLDPEGDTRLTLMNNLAVTLNKQGKHEQAREIIEQVVEIRRRVLGDDHPDTVVAIGILATALQNEGKLKEATLLFEEALAVVREHLPPHHQHAMVAINNLAFVYLLQELYEEALPLYEEVLEAIDRSLPPGFFGKGIALASYAKCLLHFERLEEAEAALLAGHKILVAAFGPTHSRVHHTVSLLGEAYGASHPPTLAAGWRAELPVEQEPVASSQPSPVDDMQDE